MIEALSDSILPIFAVMAVGFALGRSGMVAQTVPAGINRFVLLVAVPALLFAILADAPFAAFDWTALGAYVVGEYIVYAAGYLLARHGFGRGAAESLLLGFAAAFVNHVLFVLPVATGLYGAEVAAPPIAAIIAFDAVVTWPLTVIALEIITANGRPARVVARQVVTNPMLVAPLLGIAVNLSGIGVADGIARYAQFAGAAAPPAALFALGVTLAASDFRRFGGVSIGIAGLAIFVHPLVTGGLTSLDPDPSRTAELMTLLAAGPCGAMPYALALFYDAPPHSIAKAILLSSVASLFTLAALA